MLVKFTNSGMPRFENIDKGNCFRLVNGTALYIKCGDPYTTGTNAVNLCNGSKNKIDGAKEIILYSNAVVTSGCIQ